jgi:hypothetical protein
MTDSVRTDARARWEADMSWVFKEPYRVAYGRAYPEQDNDVCPARCSRTAV